MSRQIPPRRSKISTVEVVGMLGTPYSMFSWIQSRDRQHALGAAARYCRRDPRPCRRAGRTRRSGSAAASAGARRGDPRSGAAARPGRESAPAPGRFDERVVADRRGSFRELEPAAAVAVEVGERRREEIGSLVQRSSTIVSRARCEARPGPRPAWETWRRARSGSRFGSSSEHGTEPCSYLPSPPRGFRRCVLRQRLLPPIPAISGAAVSHDDLVLEARDGNRFAAFAARPTSPAAPES